MAALLDTKLIRASTHTQIRDYYEKLCEHGSIEATTDQILQAIECGSIPPRTFALWLGVSKSPTTIRKALTEDISILVRVLAIKQLRLELRSRTWKKTWDGIGGTAGALAIFSDLSVLEVKRVCQAIGGSASGADLAEKRECFTDLFKGLHPSHFPEAKYKTTDDRPLTKFYGLLAPVCSEIFIEQAISESADRVLECVRQRDLLQHHSTSIAKEQLRRLSSEPTRTVDEKQLQDLCRHYPASSSREQGISTSMEFSLTLLRELVQPGRSGVNDAFFINDLVRPLLNRAIKKRAQWNRIHEIVNLIVQYLEIHPTAGKLITTQVGDILHRVAYCWARKPTLFEAHLFTLISHYGTSQLKELDRWDDFLTHILPSRRYDLLRFGIRASTKLDLNVDTNLRNIKGPLTEGLLTKLGPVHALSLFTRLRKSRGDENLISRGDGGSVLFHQPTIGSLDGDPEIYHIHLLKLNGLGGEAEKLAIACIERRKKQAMSASQSEQRGFYSKSALFSAVVTGSLDLYHNTLEWSERFKRDPLVYQEIYPRSYPCEVTSLLSGIPEPLDKSYKMTTIHDRVNRAHIILKGMFETACAALLEPSFNSRDWEGVFRLFFEVVAERIKLISKLRAMLEPTEDEIFNSLWEPTISLVIVIEAKANQDGYERLLGHSIRGLLDISHFGANIKLKTHDASILRFFDELSVARNALWTASRATKYPSMSTLPEALPRGLSVQHLTAPWVLDTQDLGIHAPYLSSRVMETLFPEPSVMLGTVPDDPAFLTLMGVFVNSYQFALDLYVPPSCERSVKQDRLQKVWQYAIGPLSRDRMSQEEAERFWQSKKTDHFEEWPPLTLERAHPIESPLFSEKSGGTEPRIWNPFPITQPTQPPRDLGKLTYIDLSTVIAQLTPYMPQLGQTITIRNQEIPPPVYHSAIPREEQRQLGEIEAIAAMLYIDNSFRGNGPSIFARSFPSESAARYPALILHEDVQMLDNQTILGKIDGSIEAIPAELLYQLTRNVVLALDAADLDRSLYPANTYTKLHEIAMLLIIELGKCDRPALAKDLIFQTIINRPESSSWHRKLLSPNYLRRLRASDARTCFDTFANSISNVMQARQEGTKAVVKHEGDESEVHPGQIQQTGLPHIKVTTIKFVAELLKGASFVGQTHAISVLTSLAQPSLHIDVRLGIAKTLLSILKTLPETDQEEVLTGLELFVLSAGNLDERNPLTESDWEQAEKTLLLPEVQVNPRENLEDTSPLLYALAKHFSSRWNDANLMRPYVQRILIPIIASLTQQTSRWVTLFLRKHEVKELRMPILPLSDILSRMLLFADSAQLRLLPRTMLDNFTTHLIFNIAPPSTIKTLNDKLRADPALCSQPDVQTWLQFYGQGLSAVQNSELMNLLSQLEHVSDSLDQDVITPKVIQENFFKVFVAVIGNDAPRYLTLSSSLDYRLTLGFQLTEPWWVVHGKTVVEQMIAHVNSMRTLEWERDPNRQPTVLPETFQWRLLLLDYPYLEKSDDDGHRERKCKTFADQLALILKEMRGTMYHHKLTTLKKALSNNVQSPGSYFSISDPLYYTLMNSRVLTAIYLGDVSKTMLSWLTTSDLLRVEVAKHLVDLVTDHDTIDPGVKDRMRMLFKSWRDCENEDVRRIGYLMEERHFGAKDLEVHEESSDISSSSEAGTW